MTGELLKEFVGESVYLCEEDGIYYSIHERELSYPEEGNDRSLELEEFSFWFRHRNMCINSVVSQFRPRRSILFDVGGGNGYVSAGLAAVGITPVVVEPMRAGAKNSKLRGVENVVCSTLGDAGVKEGVIPSIGLFDVLEHVDDDIGFLREIHRFLVEDGYLFLTVPAYNLLWSRMDEVGGHFRRYTMAKLTSALSSAGFEVAFKTYIFWFLPLPMFLTRVIPERLGIFSVDGEVGRSTKEHRGGLPIVAWLLKCFCSIELAALGSRRSIPFGGSCLVVAQKKEVR